LESISKALATLWKATPTDIRPFVHVAVYRRARTLPPTTGSLPDGPLLAIGITCLCPDELRVLGAHLRSQSQLPQFKVLGGSLFGIRRMALERLEAAIRAASTEQLDRLPHELDADDAKAIRWYLVERRTDVEIEAELGWLPGRALTRRRNAYHELLQRPLHVTAVCGTLGSGLPA
jgi:hypothetical protein